MSLFLLVLLTGLVTSFGCICMRPLENMREYEYFINSLGLANVVIHSEETVLQEKEEGNNNAKMKRMEVEFGLNLIQIFPSRTTFEDELVKGFDLLIPEQGGHGHGPYIKFIPQSTCSIACQEVSYVREGWILKNGKIVKREPIIKSKTQETHHHPEKTGKDSPFSIIQNEFEIFGNNGDGVLNFTNKIDLLDFIDRGQCCHECCTLFMQNMRTKLKSLEKKVEA